MFERVSEVVPYHLDPDLRPDVARRFLIEDLPHVLVFDSRLGVIAEHPNDYENRAEDFRAILDSVERNRTVALREWHLADQGVRADPRSFRAHVQLGNVAFRRFRLEDAEAAFSRAVDLSDFRNEDDLDLAQEVEVLRVYLRVLTRETEKGLALVRDFLGRFPKSPHRARARYYECYLLYDSDQYEAARRCRDLLLEEDPESRWAVEARELLAPVGADGSSSG